MASGDQAAIADTSCAIAKEDEPSGAEKNTADGTQDGSVIQAVPVSTDHLKPKGSPLQEQSHGNSSGQNIAPTNRRQFRIATPRLSARTEPRTQPSWQSSHDLGGAHRHVNDARVEHIVNSAQLPWKSSHLLGGQYLYNPQTDEIVLRDGRRFARPANVAIALLRNASYDGPFPPQATVPLPMSLPGLKSTYEPVVSQQQNDRLNLTIPGRQGHELQQISGQQQQHGLGITHPDRQTRGVGSIISGESATLTLSPEYYVRKKQFFAVGRVFLALWSEPSGASGSVTSWHPGTVLNHLGEPVFSKIRRFIVVREGNGYCTAVPITTYGGRGVAKRGVRKSEHAIVYTGRVPPEPRKDELPLRAEVGMQRAPIRIDPDNPRDHLDPMARVDLAAVHTIHHNIKAKSLGIVNSASRAPFLRQFMNVWMQESQAPATRATIASAPDRQVFNGWRAPDLTGANEGDDKHEEPEGNDERQLSFSSIPADESPWNLAQWSTDDALLNFEEWA
jgi:hypothetical protein